MGAIFTEQVIQDGPPQFSASAGVSIGFFRPGIQRTQSWQPFDQTSHPTGTQSKGKTMKDWKAHTTSPTWLNLAFAELAHQSFQHPPDKKNIYHMYILYRYTVYSVYVSLYHYLYMCESHDDIL